MSIKIAAAPLFLLLNICIVGQANSSQQQDWGQVKMVGAVSKAACAIDTLSRDQTINIGTLPTSQIARDGQGRMQPFSIRLVSCILTPKNRPSLERRHFQITFDGRVDAGLFGVEGKAKGIALQLTDSKGNIVVPGVPLPVGEITAKEMILNYSLRVVANRQLLSAGEYTSAVKFKMDYY
ncbi:TPA: fimbrial protein [Serratia fonticola]|nr:PAP fimbrial minor pilin protein precursor [Serratia fonticola]